METQPAALRIIVDEHVALAAILRSLLPLTEKGPGDEPERFFDVLRAMLFYIDEFPEQRHHPKESNLLFPKVARKAPQVMDVIRKLEGDHMQGEHRIRELEHKLVAWELLGEPRRAAFLEGLREYIRFYLEHMRTEETEILPVARRVLDEHDWAGIDRAFKDSADPLAGGIADPAYERLFTRIVLSTPEPLGLAEPIRRRA